MATRNITGIVVTDTDGKVVCQGINLELVKAEARGIHPNANLVATISYDDGTAAGIMLGKLVGMGF